MEGRRPTGRIRIVSPVAAALAAMVALVAPLAGCGLSPLPGSTATSPARIVTITIPTGGAVAPRWWSYPGPPRANVLLPAGYDPHRRYPLLLLLNGLNTDYDWYAHWGLARMLDGLGAIVVMPEGASGWYTNWWNGGQRGGPAWETYELDTVIPTILSRYPVLPQRRYHAIAGTSMGGLGAVYLAGRLPGFFGSVASLSGFVDPQYEAGPVQTIMAVTAAATANGDHHPDPVYGPPHGFYATGHNPVELARNLVHTRVFESTGTGVPAKGGPDDPTADAEEADFIYPMNQRYHAALVAAGVDVTYQVHPGGHDIPAFRSEIEAMLAWGPFKPLSESSASWTARTVATDGQLWELGYRFSQPPDRVVTVSQSGPDLSISAAGAAVTITSPSGCVLHAATPVTLRLPGPPLVSPSDSQLLTPASPSHPQERTCSS
ncbi:MAG: alpha/beta hydrolase [Acidimicrobiales bacterium]